MEGIQAGGSMPQEANHPGCRKTQAGVIYAREIQLREDRLRRHKLGIRLGEVVLDF